MRLLSNGNHTDELQGRLCSALKAKRDRQRVQEAILALWDGKKLIDDKVAKALVESAIYRLAEIAK